MNRSFLFALACALALICLAPSIASSRYGDFDAEFGAAGIALAKPAPDAVVGLRVTDDDDVLIATGFQIYGISAEGRKLTGFGGETSSFGAIEDFELLPDGRIVVLAVRSPTLPELQSRLVMLRSNGTIDESFGERGVLALGTGMTGMQPTSIAVSGSRILLAGYRAGSGVAVSLRMLKIDGSNDASFGTDGVLDVGGTWWGGSPDSWSFNRTTAVTITRSGSIFVGLQVLSEKLYSCASGIAKVTPDGKLDTTFGINGVAQTNNACRGFASIAATGDESVAIVGAEGSTVRGGGIIYNSETLDRNGKPVPSPIEYVSGAGQLPDGRLVLGGNENVSVTGSSMALDPEFGDGGTTRTLVDRCRRWTHFAAARDGSIVATSLDCASRPGGRLAVVRLLGPKGGKVAPQVGFELHPSTIYPIQTGFQPFGDLRGFALPNGRIKRVAVAIQRVDASLQQNGRCRWISKYGKGEIRSRASRGVCRAPHFMPATGTSEWRFKLRRRLPAGRYRIYLRATTKAGVSTPFTKQWDWYQRFRIEQR